MAATYGEYNTTKNPMSSKKGTAGIAGSSPMASTNKNGVSAVTALASNMYQTGAGKASNVSAKNS